MNHMGSLLQTILLAVFLTLSMSFNSMVYAIGFTGCDTPPDIASLCDPAAPNAIVGTPGPDRLNGTDGDDIIIGLGGNDRIGGKKGNDIICGGEGRDVSRGQDGNDGIDGGNGNDILFRQDGKDRIVGEGGDDIA